MDNQVNRAPEWAKGTFIWRGNLADRANSLSMAEEKIREIYHLTDGAVRQIVFFNGAVGMDEGYFSWDGSWPYWGRPTYRINHDWQYLGDFMMKMKEMYNTFVSFHVNITDVNAGLALADETRKFFERLRDNKCIYARPHGKDAQPWFGLPCVPDEIPLYEETPQGRKKLDPSDIFAMVDYKQLWDTGIACEIIDGLFSKLPFVPPLIYVDVFGTRGWCIHPGYPDGELGHSHETQLEGMKNIRDYIRKRGSDVAGESPDRLTDLDADYSWSHGGLSANDYSKIGAGFGMGCMEKLRGAKGMHVYGNQGGYHLQCGDKVPERLVTNRMFESPTQSCKYDGIREWCSSEDLAGSFYLTVIQELYHIGCGNVRLPGGNGFSRLDEFCGRAKINAVTITDANGFNQCLGVNSAELTGSCVLEDDDWAVGGKTAANLDRALFNSVKFNVTVPCEGEYNIFLRYASVGGAELSLEINGTDNATALKLPDTDGWQYYSDFLVRTKLNAGTNSVAVTHGKIFAKWSDGTESVWDRDGLKIWNDDVIFAVGEDRMWPDTWSGENRIMFYSSDGSERDWTLPENWAAVSEAQLIRLTVDGRDMTGAQRVALKNRKCKLRLEPNCAYVMVP